MNDEQIAKRYEKWIHIGSLCLWNCNSGLAAGLVPFTAMGVGWLPSRFGCRRDGGLDCTSEEDAYIRLVVPGTPDVLFCMYITCTMWMIYLKVEVSRKAEKWSIRNGGCFCILVV
jgi:hypothetical protein